jgi:hypothetical protein
MKRILSCILTLVLCLGLVNAGASDMHFLRGDANGDGAVNVADMATISMYLFTTPISLHANLDALDANDDGSIDIADQIYLGMILFQSAFWPIPNAASGPGVDQTPDAINEQPEDLWDWPQNNDAYVPADVDPTGAMLVREADGIQEWPEKVANYTRELLDGNYMCGGVFRVRTIPKGTYPRLGNRWWTRIRAHAESPNQQFRWMTFGMCTPGFMPSIRFDWKAFLRLESTSEGSGIMDSRTVLENDASELSVLVYIKNVTKGEFAQMVLDIALGYEEATPDAVTALEKLQVWGIAPADWDAASPLTHGELSQILRPIGIEYMAAKPDAQVSGIFVEAFLWREVGKLRDYLAKRLGHGLSANHVLDAGVDRAVLPPPPVSPSAFD